MLELMSENTFNETSRSMHFLSAAIHRGKDNRLLVVAVELPASQSRVDFRMIEVTYRLARRIAVLVIGCTVILAGVVMLVTPGPGLVVIPAGLAILSVEFAWARLWLKKLREGISSRGQSHRGQAAGIRKEHAERL
jgi:uncharacterized protein (TIGR02611 family)